MKYSKTTLTELSHRYGKILRKCALFNAAVLVGIAFTTPASALTTRVYFSPSYVGDGVDLATLYADGNVSGVDIGVYGATNQTNSFTGKEINIAGSSYGTLLYYGKFNVGDSSTQNISVSGGAGDGAGAYYGAKINLGTSSNTNVSVSGDWAVSAYEYTDAYNPVGTGAKVCIVGDNVNISGTSYGAIALNQKGSQYAPSVDITGKTVNIESTGAAAVHAGNGTVDTTNSVSTVNVTGDNITLKASNGSAISAMSQGVVNVVGNATITGEDAILARGDAHVNVNKSGDKVVKMDGNINFNYDKATSGTKVDANVDVTLAGADSYWTGNTTASYNTGRAPDESYLKVTSSKLTLKDGAVWNATKITDSGNDTAGTAYAGLNDLKISQGTVNIADDSRGIYVDRVTASDATFAGGPLHVNESMSVSGTLDLENGSVVNDGTITFASGSSLKACLENSTALISGGVVTGSSNLVIDSGVSNSWIQMFDVDQDFSLANALYTIEKDTNTDGKYTIAKKSAEEVADSLTEQGVDSAAAETIGAVAQSGSDNAALKAISEAVQGGDVAKAAQGAKDLAPTTSAQVVGVAKDVAKLLADVATARMAPMGVAGGDTFQGGGVWAQGLYNHSKQDRTASNEGFTANTRGIAVGVDGKLSDAMTVGFGYGYTDTSADAGHRDIDVDGHNVFLYGQYQPSSWYANWVLSYGYSKYEESKSPMGVKMKAKYHVNSYAAQLMSGYQFWTGLAPEAGFRYLLVDQESYTDGAQRIKSDKNDLLTGVAGVRYVKAFNTEKATFTPHANLAVTYDFVSAGSEANVHVIGGGDYQVNGRRLHRFGVEAGAGLTMSVGAWDLSADYHGGYRKDFQSHTGMLKAKYNF